MIHANNEAVITPTRRKWTIPAPSPSAWRGAILGGLVMLTVIIVTVAYGLFGHASPTRFLLGAVFFLAAFALIGLVLALALHLLKNTPVLFIWVVCSAVPALILMAMTAMSVSVGILLTGLGALAAATLFGASLGELTGDWQQASRPQRFLIAAGFGLSLALLAAGAIWLLGAGYPVEAPPNAAALSGERVTPLNLLDPSQPGPYPVKRLFYGSGKDQHRAEYGTEADVITQPVDGSALIKRWSALRTRYWGFGPEALPLNGRVWYPEGDGPFPLVLIVHGQHPMEDFSDPGYAYLGELLASQGFITVSVDENFLNLSPLTDLLIFQTLIGENDLRGWLLLEHLQAWRGWSQSPDSIFYQKVDMDQIALIGHSRGGEAVAAAAAFNQLPIYPDDARLRFDYHFNIRSIIGIAPVDSNFKPAGQQIMLENINYLVLHGVHDMDVFTFQGENQYARTRFNNGGDLFKAAVYIYGANHGQFNTVWGRKDLFEPLMRIYNLEQLMPAEAQQQVAKTTISAFLQATLKGQTGYRGFFQDLRRGEGWLPDTIYLSQYQDADTRLISTFEEDINLSTTSLLGGSISGSGLSVWREQPARAKWDYFGTQAVYLGWENQEGAAAASYAVEIPQNTLPLSGDSMLVFSLADANEDPSPDTKQKKAPGVRQPIDLTVEVIDRSGAAARLPLSHFSLLQPQLEARLGKAAFMSPFSTSEVVFQHFELRLADFRAENAAFQPNDLAEIRFLFDQTGAGVVVLDDIGIRGGE